MTRKTRTLPPLVRIRLSRPPTMTAAVMKIVVRTTPARKKLRSHPRSARLKRSPLLLPRRPRLTKTLESRTSSLET